MKNYKMMLNIGDKNENVKYFDRLTKNRIRDLREAHSYILFYYDDFIKKYLLLDSKMTDTQKTLFNNNLKYYIKEISQL